MMPPSLVYSGRGGREAIVVALTEIDRELRSECVIESQYQRDQCMLPGIYAQHSPITKRRSEQSASEIRTGPLFPERPFLALLYQPSSTIHHYNLEYDSRAFLPQKRHWIPT